MQSSLVLVLRGRRVLLFCRSISDRSLTFNMFGCHVRLRTNFCIENFVAGSRRYITPRASGLSSLASGVRPRLGTVSHWLLGVIILTSGDKDKSLFLSSCFGQFSRFFLKKIYLTAQVFLQNGNGF